MNANVHVVDVGKDFTPYPAGRLRSDGPYCGEVFRDAHLIPWLDKGEKTLVKLDSALGYGSSFLEEAFGGLVRIGYDSKRVLELIELETDDVALKMEIEGYVNSAKPAKKG